MNNDKYNFGTSVSQEQKKLFEHLSLNLYKTQWEGEQREPLALRIEDISDKFKGKFAHATEISPLEQNAAEISIGQLHSRALYSVTGHRIIGVSSTRDGKFEIELLRNDGQPILVRVNYSPRN